MTKYRKKTLIEAEQFDEKSWIDGLLNAETMYMSRRHYCKQTGIWDDGKLENFHIKTPNGPLPIHHSDWIITNINNNKRSVMSDHDFKARYEKVKGGNCPC